MPPRSPRLRLCRRAACLGAITCLSLPLLFRAQAQHATATQAQRSPRDWAVLATNNEMEALTHDGPYLRFQTRVIDSKGDHTRLVVESRDGNVARTIAHDGKPLTADEDAAERSRLQSLADSPSEFARHMKNDASGRKLALELIRLMPDAMIYTPLPNQDHARSPTGAPLLIFDYAPNPAWTPPSTSAEALTGLRGRVWVDSSSGWVVRIDGEIFRPVNFGWGMLAKLYPGGTVSVEQTNVPTGNGSSRWIYKHFRDNLHVRALMLKSVEVSTEVAAENYQLLPGPLTYQQAIALLLQSPLPH